MTKTLTALAALLVSAAPLAAISPNIRVVQPAARQRVRKSSDDVLLTDQLAERARSPFAGEDLITHLERRATMRVDLPSDRAETRHESARTRSVHGRT